MKHLFRLCVVVVAGVMLQAGCATPGAPSSVRQAPLPEGDVLRVAGTDPGLPATFTHGDKLEVSVRYQLASSPTALILVRPYSGGRQASGYIAHPAVRCEKGTGEVQGWFSFRGDANVDEIRVTLVDDVASKLVAQHTETVEARWVAPQPEPAPDPETAAAP